MSHKLTITHANFVIEKSYPVPPDRVFQGFADPRVKQRWYGIREPMRTEKFEMDFRVGGGEHMQYRFKEGTPFPGVALNSDGSYQDIVANQRIVTASTMSIGGRRISTSLVTIELLTTDAGTDLICTHQAAFYEGADGPQMREAGWRKLLGQLDSELAL